MLVKVIYVRRQSGYCGSNGVLERKSKSKGGKMRLAKVMSVGDESRKVKDGWLCR